MCIIWGETVDKIKSSYCHHQELWSGEAGAFGAVKTVLEDVPLNADAASVESDGSDKKVNAGFASGCVGGAVI